VRARAADGTAEEAGDDRRDERRERDDEIEQLHTNNFFNRQDAKAAKKTESK
jgi:hypothetical protein